MSNSVFAVLPKLKPSIKKRWLKALRSGKYEQGTGRLCNISKDGGPDTFCCLGVLADVVKSDKKLNLEWVEEDGGRCIGPNYAIIEAHTALASHCFVDGDKHLDFGPLVVRNDGNHRRIKQQNFKKIADHIEVWM